MKNKFMSDVFKWLAVGLLITFGFGYGLSIKPDIFITFAENFMVIVILEFVIGLALAFLINKMSDTVAKTMYLIYAALTGVTFGAVFLTYEISSIMFVFLATAIIFGCLGYFGTHTKLDLGKFSTYLLVGLLGIIILGIINIFVNSSGINLGLCIISLIIFTLYIAVDMWHISRMNGQVYEEKHAVFWAFQLYLDIINLILRLLELFGRRD